MIGEYGPLEKCGNCKHWNNEKQVSGCKVIILGNGVCELKSSEQDERWKLSWDNCANFESKYN